MNKFSMWRDSEYVATVISVSKASFVGQMTELSRVSRKYSNFVIEYQFC